MDFKVQAEHLGLEEEEYRELIELFIESGTSDLEHLQNAIGGGKAEEAANFAHSLKGAAGNLGLLDCYEAAKKIETEVRNGDMKNITESVQVLRKNIEEISALI